MYHLQKTNSNETNFLPQQTRLYYPSEVAEQFLGILSKDEAFANAQFAKISPIKTLDLTDGVRFTLSDRSIVRFRMSGNAPELRCYAEAKTVSSARNLVHQALELSLAFAGKG